MQNAFAGVNVGWVAEQCHDMTPPEVGEVAVTVKGDHILLSASVCDDTAVGLVEFWVDDALVGAIPGHHGPVYAVTLERAHLASGSHGLLIKAYDGVGNVAYHPSSKSGTAFEVKHTPANVLNNGGFEWGARFWVSSHSDVFDNTKANAHTGQVSVVLGGKGKPTASHIYQINPSAVDGKKATLRLWVKTTTEETLKEAVDKLDICLLGKDLDFTKVCPIGSITNLDASDRYVEKTFDVKVDALKEGVTLLCIADENAGKPTTWRLDDIRLTVE